LSLTLSRELEIKQRPEIECGHPFDYLAGTSTGAPLSFTKNTTNFAALVSLAFRPTT
jgi:hypothetical protein